MNPYQAIIGFIRNLFSQIWWLVLIDLIDLNLNKAVSLFMFLYFTQ